jgi:hypothetical protein
LLYNFLDRYLHNSTATRGVSPSCYIQWLRRVSDLNSITNDVFYSFFFGWTQRWEVGNACLQIARAMSVHLHKSPWESMVWRCRELLANARAYRCCHSARTSRYMGSAHVRFGHSLWFLVRCFVSFAYVFFTCSFTYDVPLQIDVLFIFIFFLYDVPLPIDVLFLFIYLFSHFLHFLVFLFSFFSFRFFFPFLSFICSLVLCFFFSFSYFFLFCAYFVIIFFYFYSHPHIFFLFSSCVCNSYRCDLFRGS